MKQLIEIQRDLKSPKGQRNTFGNYNYRSCEDILEAVKPILIKNNCLLLLSDEAVIVGDRNYIKATARIICDEKTIEVTAYAREALSQKGMADPQITGSASSYARKYALNGLFAIDDTKDDDVTNKHIKLLAKAKGINYTVKQITDLALIKNIPLAKIASGYKVEKIEQLDQITLNTVFAQLQTK